MMLDVRLSRCRRNGWNVFNWSFVKSINPAVGDNQGSPFGDATLFINQLTVLVVVSTFAFRIFYFLFL
jgi:hypothetical protein